MGRRGEQALAAVLVALGLVLAPIHALAWLGLVSHGFRARRDRVSVAQQC